MAEPIQRGTFTITDAFANALAFTDLNITKAVPILMPIWSQSLGLFLNGVDVDLTNGTVDPNMLMASAMEKYWINLTRTASKYRHGNNADGAGGFAEQAFIKLIKRMSVTQDFSTALTLPKSVNGATMTLLTYTEDLQTRKIILNLNTTDTTANTTLVQDKPAYMLVNELPVVETEYMINSQEKALYDRGLEYYNVEQTECLRYGLAEAQATEFDFNAILVYFDDQGQEDLGGVYFVNKYEQNGSFWQIPKITKRSNNTFSYDINMISQGAKVLQWTSENGSLPDALLLYEDMFRERYALLKQVSSLQTAYDVLAQKVNSIEGLLTMTNVNNLKVMADTLSTVNANDKAAILLAAVSLAYDNKLQEMFVIPKNVGNYTAGTIIPAQTDIMVVLNNIFA